MSNQQQSGVIITPEMIKAAAEASVPDGEGAYYPFNKNEIEYALRAALEVQSKEAPGLSVAHAELTERFGALSASATPDAMEIRQLRERAERAESELEEWRHTNKIDELQRAHDVLLAARAVGGVEEASRQNLELVIARLETISANNTDDPRGLADEALVCAHALLAAAPAAHTTEAAPVVSQAPVVAAPPAAVPALDNSPGAAGLKPYEFWVAGVSMRWYLKRDVDALLAAAPAQAVDALGMPTLPGCLADRLYEAISIARDRAEHAGSSARIKKWEATAADLRAALAAQPAAPQDRFYIDHGQWHDRVTGQHMWTQDQYDERYRDGMEIGRSNAELAAADAAPAGEPVAEDGIRGPLRTQDYQDVMAFAATLGIRRDDADLIVRQAARKGYVNARVDFAAPVANAAPALSDGLLYALNSAKNAADCMRQAMDDVMDAVGTLPPSAAGGWLPRQPHGRDDMTVDELKDVLANGYKNVRQRTHHQLERQLLEALTVRHGMVAVGSIRFTHDGEIWVLETKSGERLAHGIGDQFQVMAPAAQSKPAGAGAQSDDAECAARWREVLMQVGGRDEKYHGGQYFALGFLKPVDGADIMRGSVAQHFTEAIDAARAARNGDNPKPPVAPHTNSDDIFSLIRMWCAAPEGKRGDLARGIIGCLNKSYTAGFNDGRDIGKTEAGVQPSSATDDAFRRAAEKLPVGYVVRVDAVKGSVVTEWTGPIREWKVIDGDGFLSMDLNQAIDAALEHHAKGTYIAADERPGGLTDALERKAKGGA